MIIDALCASSNWMRGYAEAFLDDFVDGKREYVAVSELEKLADRWEVYSRKRDNDYECGIEHGLDRCADKLRKLISKAGRDE